MKSIICAGEKLAMLAKRYKKATITSFILLFIFNYSAIGAPLKEKDKKEIINKAYTLKIPFIENKGQIKGESVRYYAKTFGGTLFITKDGKLVYSLPKFETKEKVKGWVIKEGLVGASISNLKGEEKAVTKVSYFKGKDPSKWRRNISTYNLVSLGEVYKRIEVKVKAYGKNVEKLFYVKAGADPESIKMKIEGAKSLRVNETGELEVETGLGVIKFTKPVAYQEINGKRIKVAASYTILSDSKHVYGLKVGSYNKKETLIIDPLLASTFIGGSGKDIGLSIALDKKDGNVYITGWTYSPDYPTTSGAYDESYNGHNDVFVSKLDSNLTSFPYSLKTVGWEIVGFDGGTVSVTDTSSEILGAQVEIPADALSENTIIAISELVDVTHFSIFQLGVTKVAVQGDLDSDGDVDLDDLNILLTYRNQPASECPECDIDGDGVITVLDARKLVLLCTRPRCATE